eukprot:SAG31_NODE_2650_length_5298_cov_1.690710_3_plen_101_part_00
MRTSEHCMFSVDQYSQEHNRGGDNYEISDHDLFETYLAQYEIAFVEGRAAGAMCSYTGQVLLSTTAGLLYQLVLLWLEPCLCYRFTKESTALRCAPTARF